MKNILKEISTKESVYGRFGRHTRGLSPEWDSWSYHRVTFVQRDRKGEVVLLVVGGIEFDHTVIEEDSSGYVVNQEDTLFQFRL